MIHFSIMLTDEGVSVITWVGQRDGLPRTATSQNLDLYTKVKSALIENVDPSDIHDAAMTPAIVSDDRVEYGPDGFSFEGEAVPEEVSGVILRYQEEGKNADNLIKFMERLSNNPDLRSRKMLFTWTQAKDMVIDSEGYIIGYKGVSREMLSINAGIAAVDGVEMTGNIPNAVGTVISMPRSKVQNDPNQGCSHGLHVGSYDYASNFGQVLLEVRVDPADVVSVPRDCGFQKMRCCRYEVIAVHESDKDDVAETYEPESTIDFDEEQADFDAFMEAVPESFLQALRTRVATRLGRKNKGGG